ncbi:sugar kinase [Psychrobacillus sp. FSL K6-2836]|uniref:sugar kinase n=1 Tax=Psychrobacillus sp. FSL K6-2836 TaxID=2921548 RepID=UPI0030FBAF03
MSSELQVLTIGDAMITMNPITTGPLRYVTQFERKVGGAELNFAVGCARLGLKSKWISRLGNDEFGRVIYNFARGEGVDVSEVQFVNGCPTSVNFKEIQESGAGKTFYYRYDSPILTLSKDDIHEELLEGVNLIHLSGVYLAIDEKNLEIAEHLLKLAKKRNIPVAFDPNIRLKLWTIEKAVTTFEKVFPYVDILLTGLEEIRMILGTDSEEELVNFANHHNIQHLVIKDGGNGSRLYRDGIWLTAPAFNVNPVDTVGAGDGFDVGYVYSYLLGCTPSDSLKFANGVGALVTTVLGDNEGLPYLEDVKLFIDGKESISR